MNHEKKEFLNVLPSRIRTKNAGSTAKSCRDLCLGNINFCSGLLYVAKERRRS